MAEARTDDREEPVVESVEERGIMVPVETPVYEFQSPISEPANPGTGMWPRRDVFFFFNHGRAGTAA
jgi:hypothetical protein